MKVERTEDAERPFSWEVTSIEFSGGQEIPLEPGSLLVLIGPNSGGKSTALRDIEHHLNGSAPGPVVSEVSLRTNWNADGFVLWLGQSFTSRMIQGQRHFRTAGGDLPENTARGGALNQAAAFLIHRLDTENRLAITQPKNSIDRSGDETPTEYIHVLQEDDDLREKLSAVVRNAFGADLIINHQGGRRVWFHAGDEPERSAERDRVSSGYLEELNAVPRLEVEGDGIRSFVGTLLAARCGNQPLLLIDEPEAFLHPPQARRLATAIAASVGEQDRQAVIATHSADVLRELTSRSDRVSICRITRDGERNNASLLRADQVKELWSKPLLRSSAGLEGLFHDGVVVCEGDADARVYEALVASLEGQDNIQRADLHFVHGGGTGQLATLANAYKSLDTKTAVIADIDILREKPLVEGVVTALHGDFAKLEEQVRAVSAMLGERKPVVSVKDLVKKVKSEIEKVAEANELSNERRRSIADLLAGASDWSEAKKYGLSKLKGGDNKAATSLLNQLEEIGLFVLPVGELERWWPAGSADKSEWVLQALDKVSEEPGVFAAASAFITRVCGFLGVSARISDDGAGDTKQGLE